MSHRCFCYNSGGKLDIEFSCDHNCISYLWVFLGFGLLFFLWNQSFIAEKPLNAKSCEDSGIFQKWEQNFLLQESEGNHWQSSWLLRKCSLLMATGKLGTFICRKKICTKPKPLSEFKHLVIRTSSSIRQGEFLSQISQRNPKVFSYF